MKKKKHSFSVFGFLMFVGILCLDVQLFARMEQEAKFAYVIDRDRIYETFRDEQVPLEVSKTLKKDGSKADFSNRLFCYFVTGDTGEDTALQLTKRLERRKNPVQQEFISYIDAVWKDVVYFPVPESEQNDNATVSYSDSWMQSRTYGGKRGHEGCDIMASINERGVYPVVSMTDGIVEQVGWLKLGGWRLGIRSPSGGYFYYAHLYDYAKDFKAGDEIRAGELLGFMGDSGYSDTEGTVGNFPVHLHVGIYINDKDGNEVSVNPYWILRTLDEKKLSYDY